MHSGHYPMALRSLDHQFSLKHMEQNLIIALSCIWMLIIYQTKSTIQELKIMERDVYWKQDQGLRGLHWLPSNFYLPAISFSNHITPSSSCLQTFPASGSFPMTHLSRKVAKLLELQHKSSYEYSGLISFRMDLLDLLAVQGTLKSLLQHHSSKASIFQCSAFFVVQLSHPYMTTGKTIALTRWNLSAK